jgi:hypothetical protein
MFPGIEADRVTTPVNPLTAVIVIAEVEEEPTGAEAG